jgi:hypothetical protein
MADIAQEYELCYRCHTESDNPLGVFSNKHEHALNESFTSQPFHIQGIMCGQDGMSCFPCHDAHGNSQYQYRIKFNEILSRRMLPVNCNTMPRGMQPDMVPVPWVAAVLARSQELLNQSGYTHQHGRSCPRPFCVSGHAIAGFFIQFSGLL